MQVTFKAGVGDAVTLAKAGLDGCRGKVKGVFVGEDGRKQTSLTYVDPAGDPGGPEWFYDEDFEPATD